MTILLLVAAATGLVDKWVAAQNGHDPKAYFALYDGAHFKGVKRTRDGKIVTLKFAQWKADRTKMFANRPEVAAEAPRVSTWLDSGSTLKRGVVTVRFLQRWRTARYADHGTKILHLRKNRRGEWRIFYEDLVNSEPGWSDSPGEAAKKPGVKSDAEALALWNGLPLKGQGYEAVLAELPGDPASRRYLARALVKGGKFGCKDFSTGEECGEEVLAWNEVSPKATFQEPCLRVRLARWAIEALTKEDLIELSPQLMALLALPRAESEIPEKLMKRAGELPDRQRLDWIGVTVESGRRTLAEEALAGASADLMAVAYRNWSLARGAEGMSPERHPAMLAEAAKDRELANPTRREVIRKIRSADTLKELAASLGECNLRMTAHARLSELGKAEPLPGRPKGEDLEALGDFLCLTLADPVGERRVKTLAELLPPQGAATAVTVDDYGAYVEEGEGLVASREEKERVELTRGSDLPGSLVSDGDVTEGTCSRDGEPGKIECEFGTAGAARLSVELEGGFLKRVERLNQLGCGC